MKANILPLLVFFITTGSALAQTYTPWQSRRQEVQSIIESKRQELKVRKVEREASIAARKEEMRQRFAVLRDERRRAVAERIEKNLNQINERRTQHFLRVLDRLREILAKIQSRTDRAKENGKSVTKVEAAIAAAEAALDAAESAVNTQADRVYEIVINEDTTVRNDVGNAFKKLQEDLRSTRDVVHTARTAVHDALKALTGIVGNDDEEVTPSATPT